MAHRDFKDLVKRTTDKVLRDKAFNIAENLKYDGYQRGLASMVYKFFDRKSAGNMLNMLANIEKLAEELHKRIIRKFKKITVYSAFKDNIWGADLADMQLVSKFNKGFRFLLCILDIFSRQAWVVPLKGKKGISIVNVFQKILDDSNRKPNKIWVDEKSEFYNSYLKKRLKGNDIEMYLTHNEGNLLLLKDLLEL